MIAGADPPEEQVHTRYTDPTVVHTVVCHDHLLFRVCIKQTVGTTRAGYHSCKNAKSGGWRRSFHVRSPKSVAPDVALVMTPVTES
jgi:hypothetical protein